MLGKGWISAEWRTTESNRRARYYLLTRDGQRQLAAERGEWERSSAAINWILDWSGGAA
jgi:DNA-binding PadR family transcriptional regulator